MNGGSAVDLLWGLSGTLLSLLFGALLKLQNERVNRIDDRLKALEGKVQQEGAGGQPGPVTTEDMQRTIEEYRKTKEIIEKIRYGQYL